MANYWDTFKPTSVAGEGYWKDYKPGLLAGEDYWEDFTPDAPTETGVVGRVTGQRYQPWEKGYHNIAGLVDDSGQYDAWYDPDPPPVTSAPEWGTPEGYDAWKTKIGLETGTTTTGDGTNLPEGGAGDATESAWTEGLGYHDSFGGTPWQEIPGISALGKKLGWNEVMNTSNTDSSTGSLSSLSGLMNTKNVTMALLGGVMSGPLGAIFGGLGGISGIKSLLDGTHPALQGVQTDSGGAEMPGMDETGYTDTSGTGVA